MRVLPMVPCTFSWAGTSRTVCCSFQSNQSCKIAFGWSVLFFFMTNYNLKNLNNSSTVPLRFLFQLTILKSYQWLAPISPLYWIVTNFCNKLLSFPSEVCTVQREPVCPLSLCQVLCYTGRSPAYVWFLQHPAPSNQHPELRQTHSMVVMNEVPQLQHRDARYGLMEGSDGGHRFTWWIHDWFL